MRRAWLWLTILCAPSCRRSEPVRPDPVVADAPAPAPQPASPRARALSGGDLVDLHEARVVQSLSPALPRREALAAGRAYVVDGSEVLHAWDTITPHELWSKHVAGITQHEATPDGLVVATAGGVTLYEAGTGNARTLSTKKTVDRLAAAGRTLYALHDGNVLEIVDVPSATTRASLTLPFTPIGWGTRMRALADGHLCVASSPAGALEIACFAADGTPGTRTKLDLSKPTDPKGTSYSVVAMSDRHVLFSSHPFFSSGVRRSAVVRLSDGAVVARVDERVAAIAEHEDGSIEGLVVVQPELKLVEPSGKVRWSHAMKLEDSASALARGGRVYVDVYPMISSGSALYAFDAATGKPVWTGDVENKPVSHSEYFNSVELSFFEDRIVLRGEESSLVTLQLFAERDGKRLLADTRMFF